MSIDKILYAATATATGGREGRARSSDRVLDVQLSTPRELGGAGGPGLHVVRGGDDLGRGDLHQHHIVVHRQGRRRRASGHRPELTSPEPRLI